MHLADVFTTASSLFLHNLIYLNICGGLLVLQTTGDIYSGMWSSGKKDGRGMYQFGADESTIHGTWVTGTLTEGKWVFKVRRLEEQYQ